MMGGEAPGGAAGVGVMAALAYSFCSISMVLANKFVLSSFAVVHTFSLLLFQTVCTLVLVLAARRWGFVSFEGFEPSKARAWLPVNLCFIVMLYTGFMSLKLLAVPMVNIFKNLTNAVILVGDYYWFGARVSYGLVGSLALTVVAALLAGVSDLSFSLPGYLWMAANCLATAGYVLAMRGSLRSTGLREFGAAYYNNLLGIPLITLLAAMHGELPSVFFMPQLSSPAFLVSVLFTGVVGFCLQMSALWCVNSTSASTHGMVGAFNKIPLSVLGVFLFHEQMTLRLALFITLGLSGGTLFTLVKLRESQEAKRQQAQHAARGGLLPASGRDPSMGGVSPTPAPAPGDATSWTGAVGVSHGRHRQGPGGS